MTGHAPNATDEVILTAVYDNEAQAQRTVERLNERGVALDMLSVLGRVHPSGDDVLGIYYSNAGERVNAWAKQGALWGSVWGLVTGAAAMFVMPGLGPIFAAGPIVEAIVAALGGGVAGAAMGGALGGAAMAGAATLTQMSTAMHRMGIPQEKLDRLHQAIVDGHFVLLLRTAADQTRPWLDILYNSSAAEVAVLPYRHLTEERR